MPDIEEIKQKLRWEFDKGTQEFHQGVRRWPPFDLPPEMLHYEIVKDLDDRKAKLRSVVIDLASPKPGERLLDVPCGAGELLDYDIFKDCEYYGLDITPILVEAARKRLAEKQRPGFPEDYIFEGEADNLPFEDNFFDLVVNIGMMEYYPLTYAEEALAEYKRVLKGVGRLVVDFANALSPLAHQYKEVEAVGGIKVYLHPQEEIEALISDLGWSIAHKAFQDMKIIYQLNFI